MFMRHVHKLTASLNKMYSHEYGIYRLISVIVRFFKRDVTYKASQ